MIGADIMILLFGLGCLGLAWPLGRAAVRAARATSRSRTLAFGAGAAVLALLGLAGVAEGLARLLG